MSASAVAVDGLLPRFMAKRTRRRVPWEQHCGASEEAALARDRCG